MRCIFAYKQSLAESNQPVKVALQLSTLTNTNYLQLMLYIRVTLSQVFFHPYHIQQNRVNTSMFSGSHAHKLYEA